MLILSLLIVLIASIFYYNYRARQSMSLLQSRFNQVIGLRQLIHLLRFHRRQTHMLLSYSYTNIQESQPLNESLAVQTLLRTLINQAEQTHKPMYRILMKRLTALLDEWPRYSLQRNQAVHGKAIRHVLYLIDDTITLSLLSADKEPLFKQYQATWPITLNAIDSLSRFRHSINNFTPGSTAMKRELNLHIQILRRRLSQMAISSHNPVSPTVLASLFEQFDSINLDSPNHSKTKEQLYHFSLQVSDTLFNLFDLMLNDIASDIPIRLPELTINPNNVIRMGTKSKTA
ncbi:hypothetical protein MD588_22905 [Photobacterium sp. SDRW27]|uniref:hypothetical protein n=1 Tax=Photobacterium obscurum TaxID=2829490 RepID=UPI002243EBF6|nr:hypothetical protein [Photobacterium obscurum]MCW8331652.1 hypothetical protein [Photobacterium obscurum]